MIHFIIIAGGNPRDRDIPNSLIAEEAAYLLGFRLLRSRLFSTVFNALLAGKNGNKEEDKAVILLSDLINLMR